MGHATVHLGDNRRTQLNFGDTPIGWVVRVRTAASTWYLCRVEGSKLDSQGRITNVMVTTDSKEWGQQLHSPSQTAVDAIIKVGRQITIMTAGKRAGVTGYVVSIEYDS